MKIPKLRRNSNAIGKKVGNYWIMIGRERVNLGTQNATDALKNARKALKGERGFTGDSAAAADATIDALEYIPDEPAPPPLETAPSSPPLLVAVPSPAPAQQQPAGDWAADANAAAGSAETSSPAADAQQAAGGGGAGAERLRFGDLPFLQRTIVSISKLAVQVQIGLQVWAWRRWGGLDLAPLEEPPRDLEDFLKRQGVPWPDDDPREPGRQVWESFVRRIIPEELPIPDWLLAPALVAMFTMPVQLAGAKRAAPSSEPTEEAASSTDAAAAAA